MRGCGMRDATGTLVILSSEAMKDLVSFVRNQLLTRDARSFASLRMTLPDSLCVLRAERIQHASRR